MTIAKLRAKIATALDMGDAGKFVVLTREEAEALLAEIDGTTLPMASATEHIDPDRPHAYVRGIHGPLCFVCAGVPTHPLHGDPRAPHEFGAVADRDTCAFCGGDRYAPWHT